MDLSTLRAGQEVGWARWSGFTLWDYGFSTVVSINGHGHIKLEDGQVFDKLGNGRNDSRDRKLIDAGELHLVAAQHENQKAANRIKREIDALWLSNKNGMGDLCMTTELKAQLLELVQSCPITYQK